MGLLDAQMTRASESALALALGDALRSKTILGIALCLAAYSSSRLFAAEHISLALLLLEALALSSLGLLELSSAQARSELSALAGQMAQSQPRLDDIQWELMARSVPDGKSSTHRLFEAGNASASSARMAGGFRIPLFRKRFAIRVLVDIAGLLRFDANAKARLAKDEFAPSAHLDATLRYSTGAFSRAEKESLLDSTLTARQAPARRL
jgi:hypothetical protein